jgi:hypothetical protein
MQDATSMMRLFITGVAIGGFFGGFIGANLYSMNLVLVPFFMGWTLVSTLRNELNRCQ